MTTEPAKYRLISNDPQQTIAGVIHNFDFTGDNGQQYVSLTVVLKVK